MDAAAESGCRSQATAGTRRGAPRRPDGSQPSRGAIGHAMELLRTDRLMLRHWADSDLAAFYDLYSREEVMRWLGPHPRRPLASLAEAQERLSRWQDFARGLSSPFG